MEFCNVIVRAPDLIRTMKSKKISAKEKLQGLKRRLQLDEVLMQCRGVP